MNKNTVTFQVGEHIQLEEFESASEACFFIENMDFPLISAIINGKERDEKSSLKLVEMVGPSEFMAVLYQTLPGRYQEMLGRIAWYHEMQDFERMNRGVEIEERERIFNDNCTF